MCTNHIKSHKRTTGSVQPPVIMPRTRRRCNKGLAYDVLASPTDLTREAKIYVQSPLHKDVAVQTTNQYIMDCLSDLKGQLRRDGKPDFMRFYRSVSEALLEADVDQIYKQMKEGDKEAKKTWQNVCDDTILHALARQILWKRPIVISTPAEDCIVNSKLVDKCLASLD